MACLEFCVDFFFNNALNAYTRFDIMYKHLNYFSYFHVFFNYLNLSNFLKIFSKF